MDEIWKAVAGFEGLYEVSNLGRVRGLDRFVRHQRGGDQFRKGTIIAPGVHNDGHNLYVLHSPSGRRNKRGAPLVLETFIGPRPEGYQACHNDGNPANDALTNLRWDSPKGNNADKILHGTSRRGERHCMVKLTTAQVLAIREQGGSHGDIAAQYGIARPTVSSIKSRRYWAWL